jgi:hypothetical protein
MLAVLRDRYDLGFGFALQSTDGGVTFDSEMINLDGPWENQTAMFPKGEIVCVAVCACASVLAFHLLCLTV